MKTPSIDLDKYLRALPYSNFFLSESGNWLFYLKEFEGEKLLHRLFVEESHDLSAGEKVCHENFQLRAMIPSAFDERDELFYFTSDIANKENYNTYRISISSGRMEQMTQVNGVSLSNRLLPKKETLIFLDRIRKYNGIFSSSINLLSLATGEVTSIASDLGSDYRISYDPPILRKGTDHLLCIVDWKSERRRMNIVEVSPSSGELKTLLPEEIENSNVDLAFDESEDDGFFFSSAHSGYIEAYYFYYSKGRIQRLTDTRQRNSGLNFLRDRSYRGLALALPSPSTGITEIQIYDFSRDAKGDWQSKMKSTVHTGNLSLLRHENKIWAYASAMDTLPHFRELDRDSAQVVRSIKAFDGDERELIHSKTRYITYRSFDGLEIPAHLSLPRGPVKGAVIEAFYGGSDRYRTDYQILLEQGIACLSPAVRGSWGWGAEWEQKLQGDLGGGEILDLVWGAKYLEEELGLKPQQIGVEGGSHGGYAVLRALTLPQGFKGVDSKYPFGFGIAWAGFADLVDFYETSWISDWLVNLLGPIEENRDLYIDRSPVHYFKELDAPLFIAHGTNDARVAPSSMEGFINKLIQSDKPHMVYYMKDQGHTAGTLEQRRTKHIKQLEFLEKFKLL